MAGNLEPRCLAELECARDQLVALGERGRGSIGAELDKGEALRGVDGDDAADDQARAGEQDAGGEGGGIW